MAVRGFILGVMLTALVGWCMVRETVRQVSARYELADLSRREDGIRKNLEKLRAEEDALRSPARLAALVREKRLKLLSLGNSLPEAPDWNADAGPRRPGVVLDRDYPRSGPPVRMAALGDR